MPHALAAHLGARDLDAAFVADNTLETNTLIFAARALPVLRGAKDTLTEQAVFLRLERAIIDGFRLRHLAVAPRANLLRAGEADTNRVKIVDFEHWWSGERFTRHISRRVSPAPISFPNAFNRLCQQAK